MALLGDAVVKVDGQVLRTVEGTARLTEGGKAGTTRKGGGQIHGRSTKVTESQLVVEVVPSTEFDTAALREISEAVIEFTDANGGPGWVVSRAWFIDMGPISEGESASFEVTFEGEPAQKVA